MKIHRPLAEACSKLLDDTLAQGKVLDRVLSTAFRSNRRWGKRDRHFIADTVFEVVRWKRAFEFITDSEDPNALLACAWTRRGYEIPEWWKWQGVPAEEFLDRFHELPAQPRAIRESIPDWLDKKAASELGDEWDEMLPALNERAPVYVRVNTLKMTRDDARTWLTDEGVEVAPVEEYPDALELPAGLPRRLANSGRVEIQDLSSQLVAPFTGVEPGMKVIDVCAGAGGKTLHLAALMQGQGEIIAMDTSRRKLDELWKRTKAAGLKNVKIEHLDSGDISKWQGWADRLLIDSPCSGLGTLRRQPDLKWRLTEAGLAKVMKTQRRLLDHYPEMLRKGGQFIYGTCSVLPCENQGQINNLMERDSRWSCEESRSISPGKEPGDGFFMARLSPRAS